MAKPSPAEDLGRLIARLQEHLPALAGKAPAKAGPDLALTENADKLLGVMLDLEVKALELVAQQMRLDGFAPGSNEAGSQLWFKLAAIVSRYLRTRMGLPADPLPPAADGGLEN